MAIKKSKNIKSQAWLDLLTGDNVERAATRVDDKSSIKYSRVDVDYDKNGNKIYKEHEVK